jgi:hypothetical protein
MSYSYATQRKIRIIEEKLGKDWKEQQPDKSIDAIYNELVGDTRKNLFCKIDANVKQHLDEMTKAHKSGMAEFIEQIIEAEYARYQARVYQGERALLEEFTG